MSGSCADTGGRLPDTGAQVVGLHRVALQEADGDSGRAGGSPSSRSSLETCSC